jgi:WD40 repeat protein
MTVAESALQQGTAPVSSGPYVGPRPFERSEEHLFFGRDREARDLVSLIIANRVFVLYSQSGAGKSSLLNTKIVGGLEKANCRVLPIARVQGQLPAGAVDAGIRNIFSLNAIVSMGGAGPNADIESLSQTSIAEFVAAVDADRADHEEPIVLIFDQFEELFSFYEFRWPDRAVFLREIIEALDKIPELKVVFSLREDYIAKLDSYGGQFPNRLRARYHLERLQERAAIEAIANPAKGSDHSYQDGVAETIVKDLLETHARDLAGKPVTVRGEFVEPVQLQVVCSNLWSSVPASEQLITRTHLEKSGSVDEALRKFYDASLASVAKQTVVAEQSIRRWFDSALVTSAGTRGTVFRDVQMTAGMPNRVVDSLENVHLIRGDWRAGAQWFEITHDRLLRPIRESNRAWLEKVTRNYRLKIGIPAAALGLSVLGALGWSLTYSHEASRRVDAQILASTLVEASSKLPQNNIDLALLLAVEAYRTQDSTSTRSNLLSQLLRADRIERIDRVSARDLLTSVVIPKKALVASVTSDRNLLLWKQTGEVVSKYPLAGDAPFGLFADRSRVYVFPSQGEAQTFDSDPSGTDGGAAVQDGDLVDQLKAGLSAEDSANPVSPGPEVTRQANPNIRSVALADGRLLVARRGEVIISNTGDHSEIARFQVGDDITGRRTRVLDVRLSPNGKYAFALLCETDDRISDKASNVSPQTRAGAAPATLVSCIHRTPKFWDIDKKAELYLSTDLGVDTQSFAIGDVDGGIWIGAGKGDGSVSARKYQLERDDSNARLAGPIGMPVADISVTVATPIADLLFSERSSSLISISGGQAISWNLTKPRRLERKLRDGMPYDIAIGGDGRLANIGSDGYFILSGNDQRELFSGTNTLPRGWEGMSTLYAGVALAKDRLLVGQYGVIDLWDTASKQKLTSLDISPAATVSVALDPLGQYFAAGYLAPWVRDQKDLPATTTDFSHIPILWTIDGRQPVVFVDLTVVPAPAKPVAPAVDQSPTVPAPPPLPPKVAERNPLLAVAVGFSPDGKNFVVTRSSESAGGTIEIYRRSNPGDPIPFVKSPSIPTDASPYFIAFSADGKLLAVSQSSGEIMLVDLYTNASIGKLRSSGAEGGRLAISSDGSRLAVISFDGAVILWDIASRTQFGRPIRLGDFSGVPTGLAFSPDSRRLLAGDPNLNGMVAFDLDVGSWIGQACQVAGRSLSEEERRNYRLPANGPRTCASP